MNLAIIPARGGSERIKNKNIIDFCGDPLISYSIKSALRSKIFDKVHVSTDSEEIACISTKLGIEIDFMRDDSLADSETGILPVAKWTLEKYKSLGQEYNNIVLLMPTAPLITELDITKAFQTFLDKDRKHPLFTCAKFPVLPQWAFKQLENGNMSPINPDSIFQKSQDFETHYYDTGSFSILTKEQILYGFEKQYIPYKLPGERAVDIDTYEDLKYAETLYRGLYGTRYQK